MSRVARVFALLLALGAGSATSALAQEREGLFFGVGFGYGSLGFNCDGCQNEREGSYSGNLRLGWAISPKFLVGVESEGFYKDRTGGYITAGTLTASAYYYPIERYPLFVRGGAGLGLIAVGVDGFDSQTETGFGWSVGIGYDFPVGPTTGLTPYFNYMMGDFENGTFDVFQAGLALSIY